MIKGILKNKILWLFFAAALSTYALIADFSIYIGEESDMAFKQSIILRFLEQLRGSVIGKGNILTLLTVALISLYGRIDTYAQCRNRKFVILAFLLSFCTILYYPYSIQGSICLMYSSRFQIVKSLIFLCGYSILFYYGIIALYQFIMDSRKKTICKHKGYWRCVSILSLLWLPHLLVKLPAAFCGDTVSQIWQALGLETYNAHHPLFMTWILKICLWIGQSAFSSNRAGAVIYFLIQAVLLIFIFSYTIYYLEMKGISKFNRNIIWLIYAFCPFIVGYIGVILKDVLYSAFFLLFIIFCVQYLEDKEYEIQWKTLVGLTVSGIFTVLMRNNGKEVIYPTLFVIAFITIWKNRKVPRQCIKAILVFTLPVVCATLISKGLVCYYSIVPGSIAEALSLPFQQTARTVYEHGEEILVEEQEAIDVVLEYDSLAERYNPLLSDPVKFMYNPEVGKDELLSYAQVWLKHLVRYPRTYIDATLHQNYPLFCILQDNYIFYYSSTVTYKEELLINEYKLIEQIEALFVSFYELAFDIPVIGIFSRASFYSLLLLILTFFILCDRDYKFLIPLLPMWMTIGISILGPAIMRHPRYSFPIIYSLPFFFGYYVLRKKNT